MQCTLFLQIFLVLHFGEKNVASLITETQGNMCLWKQFNLFFIVYISNDYKYNFLCEIIQKILFYKLKK